MSDAHIRSIVVVFIVVLAATAAVFFLTPRAAAQSASSKIPDNVRAIWLDPDAADAKKRGAKEGDAFYYRRPFTLLPAHITLLRKARFVWDNVESGQVMLDPKMPYGRKDLLPQLAEFFGTPSLAELAMRHVEMTVALRTFLRHGRLAPGTYAMTNISAAEMTAHEARLNRLVDFPLTKPHLGSEGRFTLTDEHLKVIKVTTIEWPGGTDEAEDILTAGGYPSARGDGKRPYGDMSYFTYDMLKALGRPAAVGKDGNLADIPEGEEQRLTAMHFEMLGAIQAFVEHAAIMPGSYD
jgi:hypothetical protein